MLTCVCEHARTLPSSLAPPAAPTHPPPHPTLGRRLDVDILVTGGTHEFGAYRHEGRFVVNPGTATGAYSPAAAAPRPSFVLMDIAGSKVGRGCVGVVGGWSVVGGWMDRWVGEWAGKLRVGGVWVCGAGVGLWGWGARGSVSAGACHVALDAAGVAAPTPPHWAHPARARPHALAPPPPLPWQATCYVYELAGGEVKVDKLEFSKDGPAGSVADAL